MIKLFFCINDQYDSLLSLGLHRVSFTAEFKKGVEQIVGVFWPMMQNCEVTKGLINETALEYY